jgi:glycine cleavage system H protein
MQMRGYDFPDALHYLVEFDMWARRDDDGLIRVGATALGAALAGEIVAFMPKRLGEHIPRGRSFGAIELFKTIISAKAPVGGVLIEANPVLERTPTLINRDPYGEGWMARIEADDWMHDSASLAHGAAVVPAMERAWQGYREDGYDV